MTQCLERSRLKTLEDEAGVKVSILNSASFGSKGFRAEHLTTDLLNRFISNIQTWRGVALYVCRTGLGIMASAVSINTVGNNPTTKLSIAPI